MWLDSEIIITTLLCFILLLSTLCCGHVITTPRRWISGEKSQVCVILSAPASSVETVTFEMKELRSNIEVLVPEKNIIIPEGMQSICEEIFLPLTKKRRGDFTIIGSLEGQKISYTREVKIAKNVVQTYIQTDKYLYKPYQTVKFRIITVNGPYLQVSFETYKEIWIESPSGTILKQWLDVANKNGLIHLSFKLSDEPEEGTYKIKVRSIVGKIYKCSFRVKEYVLPRFKVTINPPDYVLGTTELTTFKVCANYTFGQPVKGNVSLSVYSNDGIKFYKINIKRDQIFGCKTFNITTDELCINEKHNRAAFLKSYAVFTEEGTGVELNANEASVHIFRTVIKFKDISVQKYYKPELPYVGKVKATFHDGKSVSNELMKVCCGNSCRNMLTEADGILHFAIPPHLNGDITITAPGYPRVKDANSNRRIMDKSSLLKEPNKYYSPSNSSLIIYLTKDDLECPSRKANIEFELPVMFAVNQQNSASVSVQIVSRGQIQFHKTFNQTFVAGSILPIPDSFFIEPIREPSTSGLVRGFFTVLINLPKTVSPKVKILVWYARNDGEVVSDTREVSIMECLLNSVTLSWSTDKALPGTNASVSVTAEPLSLCSLGVVDKSVQLLSDKKNSLTITKLLKLAQRASATDQSFDMYNFCRRKRNVEASRDVLRQPIVLGPPMSLSVIREKRKAFQTNDPSFRRSKWPTFWLPYLYPDDVDASHIFIEAGIYVLSDLTLKTNPCQRYEDKGWGDPFGPGESFAPSGQYSTPFGPGESFAPSGQYSTPFGPGESFAPSGQHSGPYGYSDPGGNYPLLTSIIKPSTAKSEDKSISVPNVEKKTSFEMPRTYFPETWIWTLFIIRDDGLYKENLTTPDTVTEWVGSAVCVHPSKGVGISNTASITTFKEFFVDLTVPSSVKRGEIFPVKISIFNYLNESLPIKIVLESPDDQFDILTGFRNKGGSKVRTICVPEQDKTVLSIRIRAKEVGDVNISVKAIVQAIAVDNCGSGIVQRNSDFLIKPIRVNFEGFFKEETQFDYVCTNGSGKMTETWNVTIPNSIVPDSPRGYVAVVGDLMGPTLQNLGSLVKMPCGCGEQNMLNFAPNIFVMQYLEATNQNSQNIAKKAIDFMAKGYKQELEYRHNDGSFSAFGESDKSGSTWLTAFVLKCFGQARQYIKVDSYDLSNSKEWLKSKQLKTGCFISFGKVVHKGMKGGLSRSESPALLTAFVLIALIEAGESFDSLYVGGALLCINTAEPTTNPYNLAVKAYALALAKSSGTKATLDKLLALATTSHGKMYWEIADQYEFSEGVAVETASYAVLALLTFISNSKDSFINNYYLLQVFSIIKWINTQRNGQGGFISTQDTIIALQALAAFEKTFPQGSVDLTVLVTMANVEESFRINDGNKLLQQSVPFHEVPTTITFDIVGQGCFLLQSVLRYNLLEIEANEAFSLRVTTKTEQDNGCKTKRINVCASYLLPDQNSNMAIIEIDLVSGYIPEKTDLKHIIGNGTGLFKRYEVDGSTITIYVDEFSREEICASFRILREVDAENPKPGTAKVYDYYKPEYQVGEIYTLPPSTECFGKGENFYIFDGETSNAVESEGKQQS